MLTRILATIVLLAFISTSAESAPRRAKNFERTNYSETTGRPSGCPHAWCGCWLAMQKGFTGATARALWLARNWAVMFPRAELAPGNVAVFARGRRGGHVGEIVAVVRPGVILLRSGNDGRAVRTRERSTRGLIAVVNPHGGAMQNVAQRERSKPVKSQTIPRVELAALHSVM